MASGFGGGFGGFGADSFGGADFLATIGDKSEQVAEVFERVRRLSGGREVAVVVASKYFTEREMAALAAAGARDFGENRVQDFVRKRAAFDELAARMGSNSNLDGGGAEICADFLAQNFATALAGGLRWHFIGRLQTNKINAMLRARPLLWHSCEGVAMAREVDKRIGVLSAAGELAGGEAFRLPTLLQINASGEASKQGVSVERAIDVFDEIRQTCGRLELCGVMTIASRGNESADDERRIRAEFEACRAVFERLGERGARLCSMGMSGDYELALQCGANIVRLGSAFR